MTSEQLKKLFAHYTEDVQFQNWSKEQSPVTRFVYACEYGTFWKFTTKAWWQFVTRVVRNNGGHDFLLSKALRSRPSHIIKGEDDQFYSTDDRVRCVNPLDWTLLNWANELIPGSGAMQHVQPAASMRKPNRSETSPRSGYKSA